MSKAGLSPESLKALCSAMTDAIVHRGPDDQGHFVDSAHGLALGHRRLSILDLSPLGHQPMASHDGRYVMVFNGEVYNFQDLRDALAKEGVAPPWRGHSDTEVMLACFSAWGIEKSLQRFNGMFAFAVWDTQEKNLTLARDRIGKKPLYYGLGKTTLLFGSELKSLWEHPDWNAPIDQNALSLFLQFSYIPAPYSIFKGIFKLPPGGWIQFTSASIQQGTLPRPSLYWDHVAIAKSGLADPSKLSFDENIKQLKNTLLDAVKIRMISDVPLGAFLSGGIDSSLVTALMQANSSRPVKTFSIGFKEDDYNEAPHAKAVANHLGTDHTEFYVSPQDALDVIPLLPHMFDEPFADSSQIPTYLVSKLARSHVTVALSGDGGDEFFYGYSRYQEAAQMLGRLQKLPRLGRSLGGGSMHLLSQVLAGMPMPAKSLRARRMALASRLHSAGRRLPFRTPIDFYLQCLTRFEDTTHLLLEGISADRLITANPLTLDHLAVENQMMLFDATTYLPDDIMVKVDRASMAVSLETRAPLLDYRVVEAAWRLPFDQKFRASQGKSILRQILYEYVPASLIDRPKMGFGVPVKHWLNGPLKSWMLDLLSPQAVSADSIFKPAAITTLLQQQVNQRHDHNARLWNVLMFQAWLRNYKSILSRKTAP